MADQKMVSVTVIGRITEIMPIPHAQLVLIRTGRDTFPVCDTEFEKLAAGMAAIQSVNRLLLCTAQTAEVLKRYIAETGRNQLLPKLVTSGESRDPTTRGVQS